MTWTTLNGDNADQLRDLAGRLDRASRTAETITDAHRPYDEKLRDFSVQAGLLADAAREIAEYAQALEDGQVRHVTGVASRMFGDKVQLHVHGEPEPLVTSVQAIIQDIGIDWSGGPSADPVDGHAFTFTVITTFEEGDPVETPVGFQVAPPVQAGEG